MKEKAFWIERTATVGPKAGMNLMCSSNWKPSDPGLQREGRSGGTRLVAWAGLGCLTRVRVTVGS